MNMYSHISMCRYLYMPQYWKISQKFQISQSDT